MRVHVLSLLTCVALALHATAAEVRSIETDRLLAAYDADTGTWSLAAKGGNPFALDGKFAGGQGGVRDVAVNDPHFGAGKALLVTYKDKHTDRIELYPGLPFALFRSSVHNAGPDASVTRQVKPLTVTLDQPVATARALGTGGLQQVGGAKDVGSYMWLAVADPQSRRGVVAGFLTTDRGSGVVLASPTGDGRVQLTAQVDYGRLRLEPDQVEPGETYAIGYFDDARLGLEAWADAVAKVYAIHLPPQPVNYCTWYHAGASNEKKLAEQTAIAADKLKPYGLATIQIDDGWQLGQKLNGPKKDFTGFNPKGPYPSGMKATADHIRAANFTPGLWFMPFAGTADDPAFAARQAIFSHAEDGKPFDTKWGGTCLDMTNPAAQDYVRGIVKTLAGEWGYRYFKMDGLYTGTAARLTYVNDGYKDDHFGESVLFDPARTHVQAYRDGLRLVREAAGPDVFLLGCCANQNMRSYGGAFGLVDAMRIGPDNGPKWSSLLRGPTFGSRNYHLHGRVWFNDPDPLYVRANVPLNEARAICSWVTVSGQLNTSSDAYGDLPAERLDLLKRTMPSVDVSPRGGRRLVIRPVDLFEQPVPRVWEVDDCRVACGQRTVVGLFNWGDEPAVIECPLDRLSLERSPKRVGFEYWSNAMIPPVEGTLRRTVPAHSCEVIALRIPGGRPQVISTSRHVLQGVVDLVAEEWSANTKTLSGTSQVVGGDAYELRVVVPEGMRAASAEVSDGDAAAGVTVVLTEAGEGLARVTIRSAGSRDVKWSVRF